MMPQIQLNDHVFQAAQRRAADGGFSSVEEYIADVVIHDVGDDADIDHLFTPERLAHIDEAEAEIKAGKSYTAEQADVELAKRRAEWLRNNPR
jgi:hypothetical protein